MDEASNYAALSRQYRSADLQMPQATRVSLLARPHCASAPPCPVRERSPTWRSQREVCLEIPEARRLAVERQRLRDELAEDFFGERAEGARARAEAFEQVSHGSVWRVTAEIVTLWMPDEVLEFLFGITELHRKRAWRERTAFCQLTMWVSWAVLSGAYYLGTAECGSTLQDLRLSYRCLLSLSILGTGCIACAALATISLVSVLYYRLFAIRRLLPSKKALPAGHKPILVYLPVESDGGLGGVREACDSIVRARYEDRRKILLVVFERHGPAAAAFCSELADGQAGKIGGYAALAGSRNRAGQAAVYAGAYRAKGHDIPAIAVVKSSAEADKRDSLHLLLGLLSAVHADDRMTELEYELHSAIQRVSGHAVGEFGCLLLALAGAKVHESCLATMSGVMDRDRDVVCVVGGMGTKGAPSSLSTHLLRFSRTGEEYELCSALAHRPPLVDGRVSMWRIADAAATGRQPMLADAVAVGAFGRLSDHALHRATLESRPLAYLSIIGQLLLPHHKTVVVPSAAATCSSTVTFVAYTRRAVEMLRGRLASLRAVLGCPTAAASARLGALVRIVLTMALPSMTVALFLAAYMLIAEPPSWSVRLLFGLSSGAVILPVLLVAIASPALGLGLGLVFHLLLILHANCLVPLLAFWGLDADVPRVAEAAEDPQWRDQLASLRLGRLQEWSAPN